MAIIGASTRQESVGHAVFKNAIDNGYKGKVFPVNIKGETLLGQQVYPSIGSLPQKVDLAVIVVKAPVVPQIVKECGEAGVGGLVIISAGFKEAGNAGERMVDEILAYSQKYGMRIVGPNCLGFINPTLGVNVTFANHMALNGKIAFISQSGAICSSILDWAKEQNVGFSHFVSIGSMIDIGFADMIDYFGMDPSTSSILIYMESITNARRFMSAARAFSRAKPIVILKSGRSEQGTAAAMSHTGSLAGNDAAFDAAFKRAGCIRVDTISQLFDCAQSLSMQPRPKGNRLAIVTNAGGPGVLATDYLISRGGQLAELSDEAISKVSKALSPYWSHGNPVDVLGDASPEQYHAAIQACLECKHVDGVLTVLTAQSMTDAVGTAECLARLGKASHGKPLLACWMGESDVREARSILEKNKIPEYRFPENAVDVFLNMYQYTRNLELLYETPPEAPAEFHPRRDIAWHAIRTALMEGRKYMLENESKGVLACYELPVGEVKVAKTAKEAVKFAKLIGYPIVMKIVSPDALHKTDVDGVRLSISSANEAEAAFNEIIASVKKYKPDATIVGVLVEKMLKKRYELLLGAKKDPIFGPIILFGHGGIAVEVNKDTNTGLPPLNMALAKRIIQGTRIYKQLKGFRGTPSVDLDDLAFQLQKFAYIMMDFPEVSGIDVNPYLVDETGGVIVDARILLEDYRPRPKGNPYQHLVISPYPEKYVKLIHIQDYRPVLLRPIRPEDEPMEAAMFAGLSDQSVCLRFLGYRPRVTHDFLSRLTHIDYDREMAIIAEIQDVDSGQKEMAGVVRIIADCWGDKAEFAIIVADKFQGQSLGSRMVDYSLEVARDKGIRIVHAFTLRDNTCMIQMLKNRGFSLTLEEDAFCAELDLEHAMPFATQLPFQPMTNY
jgi:acetyltransferase